MEEDLARLRVRLPEVESLVPILALLRHALALPELIDRLYFAAWLPGRRRFEALARVGCAGLVSLLTPRLGPFLSLVDFQRDFWLPRLVNLEPSIPEELAAAVLEGLPALPAGRPALIFVDFRETVIVLRVELSVVASTSLAAALVQRPSSSLLLFIAHSSKSSEAEAGRAAVMSRSRNNGTIDALM